MSIKKQELYSVIENLPEELLAKVIDYIEYLKFTNITNKAPYDLVIQDKEDLVKKLEEGMKDTDEGKICSIEETFSEIEEILAN